MNPITKKPHPLIASVTALTLFSGPAMAAPVTVANFSFEEPDITNAVVNGAPTGWLVAAGGGAEKYRDNYAPLVSAGVPDGGQWALITATGITNKHFYQNTGHTIVEGETYTLTVAVGEQENQAGATNIARIFLYGATTGDASPFALLDNIDPIGSGDASAWFDYQVSFTATSAQAGEQLVIGLGVGSFINDGVFTNSNVSFDNVRLQADTMPVGSPVIYEPFNYASTGNTGGDGICLGDGNQGGATGLSGTWSHTSVTNEMEVAVSGLTFTDAGSLVLPVSGNSILRSAREGTSVMSSAVDPAATTALTADNTTMWMSFLYVDNGFSGPDSSVMLASEPLASGNNHALAAPGYGVGILIGEGTVNVASGYYLNSTTTTLAQSTVSPDGANEGTVFLLAAKINWKPDGTPDEIFVFNITDLTTEPSEGDAIASDTFDMPLSAQQSLDTLNIGETQIDGFDEIRFGTSFADVVGFIYPPTPADISLSGFSYSPTTGDSEVSILGAPSAAYILVEADDLDFGNPDQNPVPLTGASVGVLNGNQVITDGSGNATVQFNLGTSKTKTFIRAQTAP